MKLASPSSLLQTIWPKAKAIPGGKYIFSKLVGLFIPYTGSVSPYVTVIEPGHAIVQLKDKRKVRNHLKSIHAIALINLGEFTTGLTLTSKLPDDAKAILVHIQVDYPKKARGTLTAEANYQQPIERIQDIKHTVHAVIQDESKEVVCNVYATWQVRFKDMK